MKMEHCELNDKGLDDSTLSDGDSDSESNCKAAEDDYLMDTGTTREVTNDNKTNGLEENYDNKQNDKGGVEDDIAYLPIDKGWAWVILAGATFQTFLYGGLMKSYGVFFVEFQKRYGSNASETNVMQTVQNIILSFSGVIISNIGLKYISPRTMVFIGGIVTFLSYLISAFLTDIRMMSLTMGFMAGVSNAMMFLPFVASIGIYFKRHRGLANSIHVSGSSIGSLVFGPFYTSLFDSYGYTGTMMLVAAILFNCVIGGALIRPVSFYKRKCKWKELKALKQNAYKSSSNNESEIELIVKEGNSKHPKEFHPANHSHDRLSNCINNSNVFDRGGITFSDGSAMKEIVDDYCSPRLEEINETTLVLKRTVSCDPEISSGFQTSPHIGRLRANTHSGRVRTISETLSHTSMLDNLLETISKSKIALYASGDISCETTAIGKVNVFEDANVKTVGDFRTEGIHNGSKSCAQHITDFIKSVFDTSVFGLVFVHYMCLAVFSISGSIMMSVYLIPYAKEVGATSADVSIIFVVLSCVDLTSRIFIGLIADRKWLKPTTIVAIGYIIIGVICQLIRFFTQFWSLVVLAIVQGACAGCYICLYNVILIEHMGLDKFKSCIGFTVLFHGISIAVFYQITGLLRDVTGNYYYTYHLIGAILLLGSVLCLTLPLTSSFVQKKRKKKPDT